MYLRVIRYIIRQIFSLIIQSLWSAMSSPTTLYTYAFLNLSYFQETVFPGDKEERISGS